MSKALIIVGTMTVFAVLVMPPESEVERVEDDLYAKMVCLGISTDMDLGWPNYKNLNINCE